jgi:predicted N-acyltransferase
LETDQTLEPTYLVLDRDDRTAALLPTYRWAGGGDLFTLDCEAHHSFLSDLVPERAPSREEFFPTLLVGSLGGFENGLVLIDPSRTNQLSALRTLLADWHSLAAATHAPSALMPFLTPDVAGLVSECLGNRVELVATAYSAKLEIRWGSFDEYLGSLGDNQRHAVRREMRAFVEYGCEGVTGRLAEWGSGLAPLLAKLLRRHGRPGDETEVREHLASLAQALPDENVVFVALWKGDPIGFVLVISSHGDLYVYKAGFDYEHSLRSAAYFNVMFYLPIRFAIDHGYGWLHLGTAALEPKLRRGAHPQSRWSGYVWPNSDQGRIGRSARFWNQLQYQRLGELCRRFKIPVSSADDLVFAANM